MKIDKKNKKEKLFNKKIIALIIFILVIFVIGIIVLLNKGTYSEETVVDVLNISCPSGVTKSNNTIECSVSLNVTTMTVKGINFNYKTPENLKFNKFVPATGWTAYANDADGLLMVNLDGVSSEVSIGTLTYDFVSSVNDDDDFEIGLVDIVVGDGENTVLNLDNISSTITVLSDVNTLDSLTLSNSVLNETFDKSKNNYTANIDSDKVVVSVTPTSEKSKVSGDIGELNLNYGTNDFEIVVTSESGIKNTYKLSIFRNYEFTSAKYIYNKDDNYLYTGTDIDSTTILNNVTIDSSLTKKIENNKLVISTSKEILLSINILNIKISKYSVKNNVITISSKMTLKDFMNNITLSNGLSYKMYNGNSQLTDSSNLENGVLLKVYYEDTLLDTYTIDGIPIETSFSFDESLNVDVNNKYIRVVGRSVKYFSQSTSVSDLIGKINLVGLTAMVVDVDGNQKDSNAKLFTGDKLLIVKNSDKIDEYSISVIGDISGDGVVDSTDIVQVRKVVAGWRPSKDAEIYTKTGVFADAGDTDSDGFIDSTDIVQVRKISADWKRS